MKKSRHKEEQIIRILREAETGEQNLGELCRKYGIVEQTFYRWRKKFGGMEVADARRLRKLEKENERLKKLLANRLLELDAMQELMSKNW